MTNLQNNTLEEISQVLINNGCENALPKVMETLLNKAMIMERENHINAKPYERNEERVDFSNGFKAKNFNTRIGALNLRIPQTRQSGFYPSCLEKGKRSERSLILAMAEMYVQGVSNRKVTKVLEEMCGLEVSSSQVSRAAKSLDEQLEKFRNRRLCSFSYLIADARYEKIRYGGEIKDLAIIWAIGVTEDGFREVVGMAVSLSEAEVHWREFFKSLVERGLHGVKYIVSDDHIGLKNARKSVFPNVIWNRCHTHLARNAQSYVSKKNNKDLVASDIRNILQASDLNTANFLLGNFYEKWQKLEPKLVDWAEPNLTEGFAVFSLPQNIRKHLRTSNLIERMNQELKRRSRVVRIFPNENSCLRLLSALALELHESWIDRRYLPKHSFTVDFNLENRIYRKKVA